jgi:serine/threonine-protein kinase
VTNKEAARLWNELTEEQQLPWRRREAEELEQSIWGKDEQQPSRKLRARQRKLLAILDTAPPPQATPASVDNAPAGTFPPGLVMGAFKIEALTNARGVAGAGSYGTVYRAVDLRNGMQCAVKVFRHVDREDVCHEQQILQRIRNGQHAGMTAFPDCLEVGHEAPIPYIALSWGGQAATKLLRERAQDVRLHLALARQTLRGLAHMHARGVLHGDFKPSNAVVREE